MNNPVPCTGCGQTMHSTTNKPMCHPCRRQQREARQAEAKASAQRARIKAAQQCNICEAPAIKPGRRCYEHRFKRTCKACGSKFFGRNGYCSHSCRVHHAICAHCDTEFVYQIGRRKRTFCSSACRRTSRAQQLQRPPVQWNCQVCDGLVTRDKGPAGMYCQRHKHTNPRQRANQQRRDALKRSTSTDGEFIIAKDIYERDCWRCGICNRRVDKRLTYPHLRSASLDHIEPLACGGTHTKDNVQLAHLNCNIRKGSRGQAQQLLLIG